MVMVNISSTTHCDTLDRYLHNVCGIWKCNNRVSHLHRVPSKFYLMWETLCMCLYDTCLFIVVAGLEVEEGYTIYICNSN